MMAIVSFKRLGRVIKCLAESAANLVMLGKEQIIELQDMFPEFCEKELFL